MKHWRLVWGVRGQRTYTSAGDERFSTRRAAIAYGQSRFGEQVQS